MSDSQREEWSRHYDVLQWGVIAIFTGGVAALLSASFDAANVARPWPDLTALGLIVVGVFYVAGFRAFRRRLHRGVQNEELHAFLNKPHPDGLPHMWHVFVASFLVLGGVFSFRLALKLGSFCAVFPISLAVVVLILAYLWRVGKPEA